MFARRALSRPMTGELDPHEPETLELFHIIGREVADAAYVLRADYVSAQLVLASGDLIVFTFDRGRVTVTGRGFEVDLTALPGWLA